MIQKNRHNSLPSICQCEEQSDPQWCWNCSRTAPTSKTAIVARQAPWIVECDLPHRDLWWKHQLACSQPPRFGPLKYSNHKLCYLFCTFMGCANMSDFSLNLLRRAIVPLEMVLSGFLCCSVCFFRRCCWLGWHPCCVMLPEDGCTLTSGSKSKWHFGDDFFPYSSSSRGVARTLKKVHVF